MAFLEWNDALLLGEGTMDDDHRRIVILINELAEIIAASTETAVVGAAIGRLIDATEEHFTREEALMRASADPNAIVHAREHGTLLSQIKILATLIGDGTLGVGSDLLRFFRGWLAGHLHTCDRALAQHLAETRTAGTPVTAPAAAAVRAGDGRTRAA